MSKRVLFQLKHPAVEGSNVYFDSWTQASNYAIEAAKKYLQDNMKTLIQQSAFEIMKTVYEVEFLEAEDCE